MVCKGAGFDFSSMRNPLRRHYGQGDLHFVTFSCHRRRPYLGTARARNGFVKILGEVRLRFGFRLLGYVVMPEHVHLLMSEPKRGDPSKVLQVLKQRVSRVAAKGKGWRNKADGVAVWRGLAAGRAILAKTVLRFPCLERKEVEGKTGVYAPKPVAAEAGGASEGLAVEQLVVLRGKRTGIDRNGFIGRLKERRENPHPYKPKGAAPPRKKQRHNRLGC